MKKISIFFLLILLIISLIFNSYQHKSIYSYQSGQNLIDSELKSTILQLNNYLNNKNITTISEADIRPCTGMAATILTLVAHSSYNSNPDVSDCFMLVNNVFFGQSLNYIRSNGEQIKVLLKSTINVNGNEINPDGCKKLSTFIKNRI